jgi:crotonobetainyl-CoA:carnitine CoA-transferase CaiB-like acyl-CoA transferase
MMNDLMQAVGLPTSLAAMAHLTGAEPVLRSSFRVDAAAQASIAASGLAAAALHAARGAAMQGVAVNMRHAAVEFRSERHLRLNAGEARESWDSIAGLYPTADGFVRLHTNFPHHRAGILALLACAPTREAVAAELLKRNSLAFETEATAAGLCVSALRSHAQWLAHPQSDALAAQPLVTIERIGGAPKTPLPPAAARPLQGLRVLDLTRVIAEPVAGRTLAAHGADVLHITAPHLPSIPALVMDTGRGKRNAALDLRQDGARFAELLTGADAMLRSYREGALAGLGFSDERMAELRPGIIIGHLSAYGVTGPWGGKRGFDSLTQTATGMNADEAAAAGDALPRVLPCQALDHASGYLLATGVMAALIRRAEEGGSWRVRVSLARTGMWIRSLGRVADGFSVIEPSQEDIADLLETHASGFGQLTAVRHAAILRDTPAMEGPAMPLGSSAAEWLR